MHVARNSGQNYLTPVAELEVKGQGSKMVYTINKVVYRIYNLVYETELTTLWEIPGHLLL